MIEEKTQITFTGVEISRSLSKILNDMDKGKIDVFMCLLKSKDRQKMVEFIEPALFKEDVAIAVRAEDPIAISSIEELRALKEQTILTMAGSAYIGYLREIKDLKLDDGAPSTSANLKKLINKRGRFVVASRPNLDAEIRSLEFDHHVRILPWALRTEGQYLTVRKDLSPELKVVLSQTINELRRTKKYKKALTKYGVSL